MKYGTVGAVALDVHGHVAAATSTGGHHGKRWGRIGDSPLIGAGTYADDRAARSRHRDRANISSAPPRPRDLRADADARRRARARRRGVIADVGRARRQWRRDPRLAKARRNGRSTAPECIAARLGRRSSVAIYGDE
jgi:hypothetical protein